MGENDHESKGLPQYEVVSSLTSLIGSAIKHVFLPDISRETVYFAEKIIVPIVAFRDHQRFNPLLLNNGHTANKGSDVNTVVRNAIEKLLLPDQELVIVDSLHDLDDHKQIFAALYSSVRTDTVYDLQGNKYIPTIHRYIDEGMLQIVFAMLVICLQKDCGRRTSIISTRLWRPWRAPKSNYNQNNLLM